MLREIILITAVLLGSVVEASENNKSGKEKSDTCLSVKSSYIDDFSGLDDGEINYVIDGVEIKKSDHYKYQKGNLLLIHEGVQKSKHKFSKDSFGAIGARYQICTVK